MGIHSYSEKRRVKVGFKDIILAAVALLLSTAPLASPQLYDAPYLSTMPASPSNESYDEGNVIGTGHIGWAGYPAESQSSSYEIGPSEGYSQYASLATEMPIWQANSMGVSSGQNTGAGLWIAQTLSGQRSTYIQVGRGSNVPLLSYSPTGGVAKIYDIWETGESLTGVVTSLNLQTGLTQGSYQATEPGVHEITLRIGLSNSQPIVVEVV